MPRPDDARSQAFIAGDHLAIDFLNSRTPLKGVWTDWVSDGGELVDWLEQAGVICRSTRSSLRTKGPALDPVAEKARAFREWVRSFVGRHSGRELVAADLSELGPLNALLVEGDLHLRIESGAEQGGTLIPGRGTFCLIGVRPRSASDQLLQPLALAVAELVCQEDFRFIRECEGKGCGRVFLDRSKAHARRWCSMRLCGNRAKAEAHRTKSPRDT